MFTSSTICSIGTFHVVIEQREMYTKSMMHVQSCSFSDQTYCFFDVPVAINIIQLQKETAYLPPSCSLLRESGAAKSTRNCFFELLHLPVNMSP